MADALTYQAMLRILGNLFDQSAIDAGILVVTPYHAVVVAPGWPWPRDWNVAALEQQEIQQRRWRSAHAKHPHAGDAGPRLRLVGTELDALRESRYVLSVQADDIQVTGPNGYRRTFGRAALERRAMLATYLRGRTELDPETAQSMLTTEGGTTEMVPLPMLPQPHRR